MSKDTQNDADMVALAGLPEGRRLLFRIIEASGILTSAYGSDGRNLAYAEGRRNLGIEILRWAEQALPVSHDLNLLTIMAALREEAQSTGETDARPNARSSSRSRSDAGPSDDAESIFERPDA